MSVVTTTNRNGPVFDPGLCRCCGSIKKCRLLNAEYRWQGQKEVYSEMFINCFGLVLCYLETAESERLICATCVLRLRDAYAFRLQVLMCEEKLLQSSLEFHQEPKLASDDVKQECEIKIEPVERDSDAMDQDAGYNDAGMDNVSSEDETLMQVREKKLKRIKKKMKNGRKTEKNRNVVKLKRKKENDEQNKTENDDTIDQNKEIDDGITEGAESPEKPQIRFKTIDKDFKRFHNTATIIAYSYVCPFDTSFSDYHCVYCREIFTDPTELRSHTENHDPGKYKDLVRLNKKTPQIDITKIDCRLCDEKITNLDSFKKHITTVHNKKIFTKINDEVLQFKLTLSHLCCTECDSAFGYFHALKNHMAVHFGNCTCDICGAHFFEERRLLEHQKSHQKRPEVTYPCKECGKVFKSKHGRYLHIATAHKKEPMYQCGKCDEVFFSYAIRCRHRIEVHGEKREFSCDLCNRSYDNRKSWREHNRRSHLKISKHKCDVCDRMFYLPCQLKEHMTTHTGERNFRCEFCGKSYPRLRALRLHMKSHSENKYRCAVCGSTFTQNVSLRNHMKKQNHYEVGASKVAA